MVKVNPVDFIDHNPGFDTAEDVHEYMKTYDRMKKHSALVVNTESLESNLDLTEAKIRCEKYLINARKLLEQYGQYIDYSKVDYTYDELFKMQEKALNTVQEIGEDDIEYPIDLYNAGDYRKFSSAMIECLQESGLSVIGWEIEQSPGDSKEIRHSYCEDDEDSNEGDN